MTRIRQSREVVTAAATGKRSTPRLPGRLRGNVEAMAMEVSDDSLSLFAATTDGDILFSANEGDKWTKMVSGLPAVSKGEHYLRLR